MANYLPATYQPNWGYSGNAQQPWPQYPQYQPAQQQSYTGQQATRGMDWVDGEAEAKGRQMPPGTTQYAMWDINEPVIYIKSLNQMGMPNPLRKAHYKLEDDGQNKGQSFDAGSEVKQPDLGEYVRKDDMERMKQELMEAIGSVNAGGTSAAARRSVKGE